MGENTGCVAPGRSRRFGRRTRRPPVTPSAGSERDGRKDRGGGSPQKRKKKTGEEEGERRVDAELLCAVPFWIVDTQGTDPRGVRLSTMMADMWVPRLWCQGGGMASCAFLIVGWEVLMLRVGMLGR